MKCMSVNVVAILVSFGLQMQARGDVDLGCAQGFAVLSGSTVTNTGPSIINGDLGVWPGTEVTGFPPGILNGEMHLGDAVAHQAQEAAFTAYSFSLAWSPPRT